MALDIGWERRLGGRITTLVLMLLLVRRQALAEPLLLVSLVLILVPSGKLALAGVLVLVPYRHDYSDVMLTDAKIASGMLRLVCDRIWCYAVDLT